ncbi:MAG: hypothetical protein ABF868_02945 [Sporolactobacillus sp.]
MPDFFPQDNPLNNWRNERPAALIEHWRSAVERDAASAYQYINDPQLDYPALFLLRDQLDVRGADLNPRVRIALSHVQNVLHGADNGLETTASLTDQHDQVVNALKWVLSSGWKHILSTDYTQTIDQTAIQLLNTYHSGVLKQMTDLIVYRYKNKSQRHYLISAWLETADPRLLVHLANYLLSDQNVEQTFARRMLGFIPEVRHAADQQTAFLSFETWYETNSPYLIYTGETNDVLPGGKPFRIHYSAKYLGKTVDPKSGEPIQCLIAKEKTNYQQFIRLPLRMQIHLSIFSARLRQQQPIVWRHWICQPLAHQLASSGSRVEGGTANDYHG